MFKSLVRTAAVAATLSCSAAAWAGCGLTITFDNDTSREITVLEINAKTTTGTYQTVHRSDFKVGPGRKVAKAIETNAGCALPHKVRAKYTIGTTTTSVSKGPIATAVDKKITLEIDN